MYKIGDHVAHYKSGVCEVIAIGKLDMSCSDQDKEYYTLKPVYDAGGTLYTPVENKRNQIRNVISKEEAIQLVEQMAQIDTITVVNEKLRENAYKEALLKNSCQEWVSLIKTSFTRKMDRLMNGKKTINVDERYLSTAENFLYGEFADALGKTKEEVKEYITAKLAEAGAVKAE